MDSKLKIGIVGPCAAGKSTLAGNLRALGLNARHIAQEHSYVPYMWQRITQPDVLIYLAVSYEKTLQRRSMSWSEAEYQEQLRRLSHAHEHAHLQVDTDNFTPQQVLHQVLDFLGLDDS